MTIEVSVPSLLRDAAGGRAAFPLEATTLVEALQRLRRGYPLLRVHLFDEAERLRPHVLIFYNEQSIAWLDRLDIPLKPGDTLTILQAVSGG